MHEPIGLDDERYHQLLASIAKAAETIEHGQIVCGKQLDELRNATRRLRRAIEVYTVCASVACRTCGDLFVPLESTSDPEYCSDACQAADRPTELETMGGSATGPAARGELAGQS